MKRKRLTILLVTFFLVEGAALVIGLWPYFFKAKNEVRRVIRLGIVPEISVKRSIDEWDVFFKRFENDKKFRIQPYFAASSEEAVDGLKYGSLDMLYTNAGIYLMLRKTMNAQAVAYQNLSDDEKSQNRSVLIASKDYRFLSQLQGKRLTFSEKNSLSGSIAPSFFLMNKLKMPLKSFFPEISYSVSHKNSIEKLKSGKTDIIATNLFEYNIILKEFPELADSYNIIWMSQVLPAPLICSLPANSFSGSETVEYFEKAIKRIEIERRSNLNSRSKVFSIIDFEYKKELEALEKSFNEYKDNKGEKEAERTLK